MDESSFDTEAPDAWRRRRRPIVWGAGSAVLVLLLGAAVVAGQLRDPDRGAGTVLAPSDSNGPDAAAPASSTDPPAPVQVPPTSPPPIQLLADGRSVDVDPFTYCWMSPPGDGGTSVGACADGIIDDSDLVSVGGSDTLDFWFYVDGDWTFQASLVGLGDTCPRRAGAQVKQTGEHAFRITSAVLAGDYRVDLFGRGKQGDVAVAFEWHRPTDGAMEQAGCS